MDREEVTQIVNAAITTRLERQERKLDESMKTWKTDLIGEVERVLEDSVTAEPAGGAGEGEESDALKRKVADMEGREADRAKLVAFEEACGKHRMKFPERFAKAFMDDIELVGDAYMTKGGQALDLYVAGIARTPEGKRFIPGKGAGGTGAIPGSASVAPLAGGLKDQLIHAMDEIKGGT